MSLTWIVSLPDGQPFPDGAGVGVGVVVVVAAASPTTAVGTDVRVAWPSAFFAVTATRSVLSLSTPFSTYVFCVAPEIAEQLPPSLSHRCHWYVNVGEPVHVPSFAVSVWPSLAVPLIVGGALFVGAAVRHDRERAERAGETASTRRVVVLHGGTSSASLTSRFSPRGPAANGPQQFPYGIPSENISDGLTHGCAGASRRGSARP
jgi:hypothetical protein